jgi:hypothetical protein
VNVHSKSHAHFTRHRGLPVTTAARTVLDIASVVPFDELRKAIAEAQYRKLVDVDELHAQCGRGQPGSAALRRATARHVPQLALTRSELEDRFLALCEAHALPLPEVNVLIEDMLVDALFLRERLIVELDGHQGHAHPSAVERDRDRELRLRAIGYAVLRYTWRQVTGTPALVAADVRAALAARC